MNNSALRNKFTLSIPEGQSAVRVPGDKSIAQRAVILGSIADGKSTLNNFPFCDDTLAAIRCIRALGIKIAVNRPKHRVTIYGRGLYGLSQPKRPLDAGESGTTARLLAGLLAAQPFPSVLTGTGTLLKRPMERVIEPLCEMGANIKAKSDNRLPLKFYPSWDTLMQYGAYQVPVPSAQVKSAMLFYALYSMLPVTIIELTPTRDHTERLLMKMGVKIIRTGARIELKPPQHLLPLQLHIPGDISSAAYFIAAGILVPGSKITIKDVGLNPHRTGIIDVLRKMGANIKCGIRIADCGLRQAEPKGDIIVRPSLLKGIRIKTNPSFIDEVPLLAVIATQARGTTIITNAQELKVKESNRLQAITAGLRRMGANIKETPDGLVINGPSRLKGATVDSYNDHRIAMSLSIAALIAEGQTIIKGRHCVNKSFPGFYNKSNNLCKRI
jgi:3-phosphoshikimate 1-carboxyvinyltransferase